MLVNTYIKLNYKLYLIFITIFTITFFIDVSGYYLCIPLILYFWLKDDIYELLIFFIFILILSDNLDYFKFSESLRYIYLIVLFFFYITNLQKFKYKSDFILGFIPFFIIAFIGMFYSGDVNTSMQKTISYILLLTIIPPYVKYLLDNYEPVILKNFLYLILIISILPLVVFYFINPNFIFIEGRYRGVMGNPNGLGILTYLIASYFFITKFYLPGIYSSREIKFLWIMIILLLFLTGSRTAILSVSIFVLIYNLSVVSPFLNLLFFLSIFVFYELIINNFLSIVKYLGLEQFFRLQTLELGSGRLIAWKFAWNKIQDFLYVGGGFGNDEYIMRKNYRTLAMLGHQGGVHNSYLSMWFNVGIFGLLAYFINIISFFIVRLKEKISLPLLFTFLFCITYESWLVASLNPYTPLLFINLTIFNYFFQQKYSTNI